MNLKEQAILDNLIWDQKNLVAEYSYAGIAVYLDEFPVTEGHMLLVPLDPKNINLALNKAMKIGEEKIEIKEWDGFNVGVNCGEVAGQTVDWPHVHLIPRRKSDCKDPAGGVRGVIPSLMNWRTAGKYKKRRRIKGIDQE